MPGQHQAQLVERDIRLLFDGCVDQARMILDRGRTPVAALRLGGRGAMLQHQLTPADRARRADPEPLGRSPAHIPPSTAATTRSRRSCESTRGIGAGLLRPAQSLNQKTAPV